jgi:hypothetical protein
LWLRVEKNLFEEDYRYIERKEDHFRKIRAIFNSAEDGKLDKSGQYGTKMIRFLMGSDRDQSYKE